MDSTDIVTMGVPTLMTVISHATLWGKMQQKQDDQQKQLDTQKKDESDLDTRVTSLERNVDSVRVTLVGIDGQNGLRSEIKKLEGKIDKLADSVDALRHNR